MLSREEFGTIINELRTLVTDLERKRQIGLAPNKSEALSENESVIMADNLIKALSEITQNWQSEQTSLGTGQILETRRLKRRVPKPAKNGWTKLDLQICEAQIKYKDQTPISADVEFIARDDSDYPRVYNFKVNRVEKPFIFASEYARHHEDLIRSARDDEEAAGLALDILEKISPQSNT